jgi:diaminopropionate ammonia-lyase
MSLAKAQESREWISCWDDVNPGATPLRTLPGVAEQLGEGAVYLKDESCRSALGSFKALGALIALVRLILRRWPEINFDPAGLFTGKYKDQLSTFMRLEKQIKHQSIDIIELQATLAMAIFIKVPCSLEVAFS